ncbi:MAG: sigma54 specific transcriptional regulator, Fis family [Oscillospiraceae bacterium]|nr:sigma54 specific transcriptional regulator, Fis family [Oscillospiraceae bacterium]
MNEVQEIIDTIGDGIYIVDREGFILAANRTWIRHINIPAERLIGRYITDVLREYYFSVQCLQDSGTDWTMREKEYEQAVSLRVLKEGIQISDFFEEGRLICTGTPVFDDGGNIKLVVTLVRDLTVIPDYDALAEGQRLPSGGSAETESTMLGTSPEMERIRMLIGEVAQTDATVLITGATGVGKEVVANEIQRRGGRADQPFVKVNCAAIPENLVEAELFGYVDGAFTGATKGGKTGLLETANHGTVLLDEIGEFPLPLQPKLLRAIQERVITRVGGVTAIPIDVRVLAATNQNLQELVNQKRFREDLYYRLNVIPLYLPSLRSRGEDISLLAKNFLQQFNQKYKRSKIFSRGALQVLQEYDWPGNIRELRNLVERLTVLGSQREITAAAVQRFLNWKGDQDLLSEAPVSLREATEQVEYRLIESALLRCGSTYKAAAALGTSQSTLIRKAKRLGIETGTPT